MTWGFYGRSRELNDLKAILARRRWFFVRITGRRRIGKTTLVQHALQETGGRPVFYVQIPDSAPAGVLSAVHDSMDTFGLDRARFPRPDSLLRLAKTVESLVDAGYVVALDEFQYFSRKHLREFTSHLQATVDGLSARGHGVTGGLIVLGSLHAELVALLDDRDAPLYNRTTDHIELPHLDIGSVLALLREHTDATPERLLFLWNLFEGVPKFYRDAYEQEVLGRTRTEVIGGMFFRSSSPLRTEADNWFLSELRGRYDVVLKFVARKPGCTHGELESYVREASPDTAEAVGGYLKILVEKYGMLEKRLPILAKANERKSRYYVSDNFLRCWLDALHSPVSAINFRPETELVQLADQRLAESEGYGLERLAAQAYEERSRRGLGDFRLTNRIRGYWDRNDTEIDLVALDEDRKTIRFGNCKRNPDALVAGDEALIGHIERFLRAHPKYRSWRHERVAIAPRIPEGRRAHLTSRGAIAQDLIDLTSDL